MSGGSTYFPTTQNLFTSVVAPITVFSIVKDSFLKYTLVCGSSSFYVFNRHLYNIQDIGHSFYSHFSSLHLICYSNTQILSDFTTSLK